MKGEIRKNAINYKISDKLVNIFALIFVFQIYFYIKMVSIFVCTFKNINSKINICKIEYTYKN